VALEPGDIPEEGTAITGDGDALGTIRKVFTDPGSGRAAWAWIEMSHAHGLIRAVPLDHAQRNAGSGVAVPYTKAAVAAAPEVSQAAFYREVPREITTDEERWLAEYYRLPAARPAGEPGTLPTPAPQSTAPPEPEAPPDAARPPDAPTGPTGGSGARRLWYLLLAIGVATGVWRGLRAARRS